MVVSSSGGGGGRKLGVPKVDGLLPGEQFCVGVRVARQVGHLVQRGDGVQRRVSRVVMGVVQIKSDFRSSTLPENLIFEVEATGLLSSSLVGLRPSSYLVGLRPEVPKVLDNREEIEAE